MRSISDDRDQRQLNKLKKTIEFLGGNSSFSSGQFVQKETVC